MNPTYKFQAIFITSRTTLTAQIADAAGNRSLLSYCRSNKLGSVKTTRKTGGLHKPYKGLRQAAPKGAVKRSADRI